LDITPPWKKDRKTIHDDLEDDDMFKPSKNMLKIPLMTGQSRGDKKTSIFSIF